MQLTHIAAADRLVTAAAEIHQAAIILFLLVEAVAAQQCITAATGMMLDKMAPMDM